MMSVLDHNLVRIGIRRYECKLIKNLNEKSPLREQRALSTLLREIRRLEMTYSRMGKPHTTIGATAFHF